MNRRKEIFAGHILTLAVLDDKWEVVEHPDAVAILVTRGAEVLGVRQFRHAVDRNCWELPAGLIDAGEEPCEAAARELAEETQLAGDLKLITRFYTSPGFTDEQIYLFEAENVRPTPGTPDETEELTVEWRDPLEVWRQVAAGSEATSSPTVVGLRHLLARRGVLV